MKPSLLVNTIERYDPLYSDVYKYVNNVLKFTNFAANKLNINCV